MFSKSNLLTDESGFTHLAHALISHTLYSRIDAAREAERSLVATLALHFLERERKNPETAHSDIFSFFGFCHRNVARSSAQIFQDLWVLYMLSEKQGGYFVEFGACDGKVLSNTLMLEAHYGWTGILAEPNREWHEDLEANRSAAISRLCVAATSGDTVNFMATDKRPELSRMADIVPDDIHEKNGNRSEHSLYPVETISLLDLLKLHDAPRRYRLFID